MLKMFEPYTWWQITIFVIGILAILATVLALFLSSERLTGDISTKTLYSVDSPEFSGTISHLADTRVEHGGEAQLIVNGDDFIKQLTKDISSAQSSVTITDYIWKKGAMSDAIFAALDERARAGVKVLILLDDLGGSPPKDNVEELQKIGGKVAFFRKPSLTRLTRFNKRTHRRAFVIDGKIAYAGGIAIQDEWLGDATQKDHWHDTMTRFTGPTVDHVQNAFAELWTATTGEVLDDSFYQAPAKGSSSLATVSVMSTPAADTQRLPVVFWYSFASAKRSIYITNPYFLPPVPVLKILEDAARRGVDVRILLPSNLTDAKSVRLASQSNYAPLLAAGVKIYEYQRSRLHSKTVVIDGNWSMIGSANMDSRSFILNEENVIGIQDAEFGGKLQDLFMNDLKDAREITKEEWSHRSPAVRVMQYLFKVFEKQF